LPPLWVGIPDLASGPDRKYTTWPLNLKYSTRIAVANEILGLMMRHWNTVAATLYKGEIYVPLLLEDEDGRAHGNDWAHGFMRGMGMSHEVTPMAADNVVLGRVDCRVIYCIVILRGSWRKRENQTWGFVRSRGGAGRLSALSCFLWLSRWLHEPSTLQFRIRQRFDPTRRRLCGSTWIAMRFVGLCP
jgi:hypothetical protein